MKKILFLWLVLTTLLVAYSDEYNEYKVDLYYANGIMIGDTEDKAQEIWKQRVKQLLKDHPNLEKRVANKLVAYNISKGRVVDM
jgi:phage terminase large subunit GpA-like protein